LKEDKIRKGLRFQTIIVVWVSGYLRGLPGYWTYILIRFQAQVWDRVEV